MNYTPTTEHGIGSATAVGWEHVIISEAFSHNFKSSRLLFCCEFSSSFKTVIPKVRLKKPCRVVLGPYLDVGGLEDGAANIKSSQTEPLKYRLFVISLEHF